LQAHCCAALLDQLERISQNCAINAACRADPQIAIFKERSTIALDMSCDAAPCSASGVVLAVAP
jgi:hypothetical protein